MNFALEGAKLQGTNLDLLQVCKTMSGVHFTVQEWENGLDLKLWVMEACWTPGFSQQKLQHCSVCGWTQ